MGIINKKEGNPEAENRPAEGGKKQVVHLDLASGYTIVGENTAFSIQEAYKTIRTNLMFSMASQKSKVVVVSSALPGEGKSTTCCNLAITMAQTGASVLLIDADMRKPVQHKIFKKINQRGLSNLLGGFFALDDVICEDVAENLDFIPSGTIPPNPSELLGSSMMRTFLERAAEAYDYIFIDSPPINVVSDAAILASISAGIVLVAKQGGCTYNDLDHALESVKFANANLLGVVINRTHEKSGLRRSYKSYKYEYREN